MEFTFKRAEEEDRDPSNNGTFITVAGCWHSMIVVGIVAHTQGFFDKSLQNYFHQMNQVADRQHCCSNSNYSIGQAAVGRHQLHHGCYYLLASFDDGFDAIADVVGH